MERVRGTFPQVVATAAIAAGLALVSPTVAAAGTLDQSQTNFNGSLSIGDDAGAGGPRVAAQTFTAGLSGNLDQVDLNLRFASPPMGSCSGGSGVTVEVRTVSGGVPSSTILASASVPASSIPPVTFNFVSFALPLPPAVTAGTQYALVVSAPDASCDTMFFPYDWGGASGNPYGGGACFLKFDVASPWMQQGNFDGGFKTFVAMPQPPTAQPTNDISFGKVKRNKDRGTAILTVVVPGPGTLVLTGKGLVGQRPGGASGAARTIDKAVSAAGKVKLKVQSKGKKKRKLNRTGKVQVKPKVTYTPTGGLPNTETKQIKLVQQP